MGFVGPFVRLSIIANLSISVMEESFDSVVCGESLRNVLAQSEGILGDRESDVKEWKKRVSSFSSN